MELTKRDREILYRLGRAQEVVKGGIKKPPRGFHYLETHVGDVPIQIRWTRLSAYQVTYAHPESSGMQVITFRNTPTHHALQALKSWFDQSVREVESRGE